MALKCYYFAALGAIAVVMAGAFVSKNAHNSDESELLRENVEALTDNEGGSSDTWACWSDLKDGSGVWKCGNPCEYFANKNGKDGEGICRKE